MPTFEWAATLEFDRFDWDSGNRDKCQKHGMTMAAIESIFAGPVVILPYKENPSGERRYRAIGTTAEGRRAFVVFTVREHDNAKRLRPISARFMHRKEVHAYEKAYPNV